MRLFARLAAGALLLATSLSTVAQPMVWQHKVDATINAEFGRDDQGNLYFAYPTRDLLNSYVKMDKLDANGRLIWSKTIDQVDVTQNKHVVKQVIFAHDRAYVLHDFETPTNDLVMSKVQEVDVVEGVSAVITATDTARYVKMAMHKKGFVVSRFAPPGVIDGVAGIQWFDLNSHLVGEQSMVGYSGVAGIACTADGKSAFIAAKSSDPVDTVVRVLVGTTSSIAHYGFQIPEIENETPAFIELDERNRRVYVVGQGLRRIERNNDVTVYAMDFDGRNPHTRRIGNPSFPDLPASLLVMPYGDVVVATYLFDSQRHHLLAFSPNLQNQRWLAALLTSAAKSLELGLDGQGNLVAYNDSKVDGQFFTRNTKYHASAASISVIMTTTVPRGVLHAFTFGMIVDEGSNYLCRTDQVIDNKFGTQLQKIRAAWLDWSQSVVPGGTTIQGRLWLSTRQPVAQTWTLSSTNPDVAMVPTTVTIPANATGADFSIATGFVPTISKATIVAKYSGFVLQKVLTVVPPRLVGVSLTRQSVIGGDPTSGSVRLASPASTGGTQVALSSSNPAAASVPASVLVSFGSHAGFFQVDTFAVQANRGVVISASLNGVSKTAYLAVNAPSLTGVSVNPGVVKGGLQSTLTVTLNGVAPTGGRSVLVLSGAPGVVVASASVLVQAGSTSGVTQLVTRSVTASTNVLVFATRSGIYKTTTITVTP